MKILVAIVTSCLSFYSGEHASVKESVCGVWKGSYGSENEITDITVKIDPQNKIEFIQNDAGSIETATGTYRLLGDSAIVISCSLSETKSFEITMYGYLNRSINFIDGEWNGEGNQQQKGCFYLQKQPVKTNL